MPFDATGPRTPFVLLDPMKLVVMASAVCVRLNQKGPKGLAAAVAR